MANETITTVVGNLIADPELRFTPVRRGRRQLQLASQNARQYRLGMASQDPRSSGIPIDSWTTDDLDTLADAHDHDPVSRSVAGSSRPVLLHQYVLAALVNYFECTIPDNILVNHTTTPPSLCLTRKNRERATATSSTAPVIAVVIVAGTGGIDTSTEDVRENALLGKLELNAQYHWRIELVPFTVVMHRIQADGQYMRGTRMTDRIKLDKPWPIDIALRCLLPPQLR